MRQFPIQTKTKGTMRMLRGEKYMPFTREVTKTTKRQEYSLRIVNPARQLKGQATRLTLEIITETMADGTKGKRVAQIWNVRTEKDLLRKGLAEENMRIAIRMAKEKGAEEIRLKVESEEAKALYLKLGFRPIPDSKFWKLVLR